MGVRFRARPQQGVLSPRQREGGMAGTSFQQLHPRPATSAASQDPSLLSTVHRFALRHSNSLKYYSPPKPSQFGPDLETNVIFAFEDSRLRPSSRSKKGLGFRVFRASIYTRSLRSCWPFRYPWVFSRHVPVMAEWSKSTFQRVSTSSSPALVCHSYGIIPCMIKSHAYLAECLDLSVGSIVSGLLAHPLIFRRKAHFSKVSPLWIFFLDEGNSDISLLLMIPLPFAKLGEVNRRIRGQNLFRGLGEEKPETVPMV
jgi:hypothetical protein